MNGACALEVGEGRLVASVVFTEGANGTASAPASELLSPLPAWRLDSDEAPAKPAAVQRMAEGSQPPALPRCPGSSHSRRRQAERTVEPGRKEQRAH